MIVIETLFLFSKTLGNIAFPVFTVFAVVKVSTLENHFSLITAMSENGLQKQSNYYYKKMNFLEKACI